MKTHPLDIPESAIAEFARAISFSDWRVFDSVRRDDLTDHRDIDVLVEFMPGHTPGFAFFGLQDELSQMLGRHGGPGSNLAHPSTRFAFVGPLIGNITGRRSKQ